MVKVVESIEDFDKAVEAAGDNLVVVDFFADWCGPCRRIAPLFVELSEANPTVTFLKVNCDDQSELSARYKVTGLPTFKFLKGGKEVAEIVGADPNGLKAAVEQHK